MRRTNGGKREATPFVIPSREERQVVGSRSKDPEICFQSIVD